MKTVLRYFLPINAILMATLSAQTAPSGRVTGRVTDATTQLPLSGARVTVAGSSVETYTDTSGDFTLVDVPAGARSVEVSYVGYPDIRQTVTASSGATTRADFAFKTLELDRFVIEGSLVGTARAINQQRAATTLTNIVAADEIGRFPDQNAAESLQRLPGVSLYRDQGEGRFILLRGINYTLGNVLLNGTKLASPETGERGIALDVLPADALAAIEVSKVPTPDMDAEGLGGQVNIRTKSAFDTNGPAASFTAQGQYSSQADAYSSKFNGSASTLFGDGKWGVIVSPTWQKRKFSSYNYEIDDGWTDSIEDGSGAERDLPAFFLQDIAFREYQIERERYGVSGALEFKPDSETSLFLRTSYNRFIDAESRQVSIIPFLEGTEANVNNLTAISPDSGTITGVRRFGRRLRLREKDQELFAVMLGGEKRVGEWVFDGQVNYSRGYEEKPDEVEIRFRRNTRDSAFRYTISDTYHVKLEQLAGASITDPASYSTFQELTSVHEVGKETEAGFGLNARRSLDLTVPAYVKAGVGYREKEKQSSADALEYAVPSSFTFASLAGSATKYPYGFAVPAYDLGKVDNAFFKQRSAFAASDAFEDSNYDDWTANEDVASAYVMGGASLSGTQLTAGLRMERTKFATQGKQLDLDEEIATAIHSSRSYTHWLPGAYARRDLNKNLVLRASWSNSIVRPSFGDSALRRNINPEDEELTVGNPNLKALESMNWDASVEYYLPSLGMVSASVFYKDIENFSYETPVADDPAFPGYDVTSFRNGSKGHIKGIELAYQQQFRSLPSPFDGAGFLANVTFSDSEADYPTRPNEKIRFIGQSDYVGNVGLTYEKYGFFARLALNFRSERLREDEPIGSRSTSDFWVDDFAQLDLTASYRFSKNWEVFAEVLNMTDEPFRVYQTGGSVPNSKRFVQVEEYDWSANFGVRWKL
ncbi:MAG TPA: TonB-dependent receptor [Opitutaceae bacterium]|nr:TonB-dependent receptor [Opitutaceae bacterium]